MSDDNLPDKASTEKQLDLYSYINECDGSNSKYSPEEKINAVLCYISEGTLRRAANTCGIPYDTVKNWRYRTSWWDTVLKECRKRKQDELDNVMTNLIDRATAQILDRIENGDSRLTKDGEIKRVPMSGKELATVTGIMFDKRAAMRGDPTTFHANTSGAEQLQKLEQKFEQFAQKMRQNGALAKPVATIDDSEAEDADYS